jgi:hypothetical protein
MSDNPIKFRFTEKMGMVLLNPTNEDIDMQYSGVSFTMKAGEKGEFETNAATHLLNSYGARGISYLRYGADENQIAEEGRKRNKDFKMRMVTRFNQTNEARRDGGYGAHIPSPELRKYADELGVVLTQPYAPKDEEKEKIKTQEATIANLQTSLAALMAKIESLAAEQAKSIRINPNVKESDFFKATLTNIVEKPIKPERPKERPGWKKPEDTSQKL